MTRRIRTCAARDRHSASLLLDPVHFSPEKVFRVHGIPDRKLIALGSPVERSEGWMRVQVDPVKG